MGALFTVLSAAQVSTFNEPAHWVAASSFGSAASVAGLAIDRASARMIKISALQIKSTALAELRKCNTRRMSAPRSLAAKRSALRCKTSGAPTDTPDAVRSDGHAPRIDGVSAFGGC
jgi:hypothetical protein